MNADFTLLVKMLVEEVLVEQRAMREAEITGDKKVPFGSEEHVNDLERRIAELTSWRNKQKRGSEQRANYSRIISKLKSELVRAQRGT